MPDYYNLSIWRIDPEHKEVYEVIRNLLPEASECRGCSLNTDIIRKRTAPMLDKKINEQINENESKADT